MKGISILIFALTGCSGFNYGDVSNLSLMSNDDLCRAVGYYIDNGRLVLKLHDEIMRRESNMDFERCHSLELGDKYTSASIKLSPTFEQGGEYTRSSVNSINMSPKSESKRLVGVYDTEKGKYVIKEVESAPGVKIEYKY